MAIGKSTGDDEGFKFFQTEKHGGIPLNLSEKHIWIIDQDREKIRNARECYYEHKCVDKLKQKSWVRAKKASSAFRYRLGGKNAPNYSSIKSWQQLDQLLTSEGRNYFFNDTVYINLFKSEDTTEIVEGLYAGIIRVRTSKADRTPSCCIAALVCLQHSGCILLPAGWISSKSDLFIKWPGAQGTLKNLTHIDDSYFFKGTQKEIEYAKSCINYTETTGKNYHRKNDVLRSLKLILLALRGGWNICDINSEIFMAVVELQLKLRDADAGSGNIARDRHFANFRQVWNVIVQHRLQLPEAEAETKKIRDFIANYVTRCGDLAREEYRRKRGHQMRKRGDLNWVIDESPELLPIVDLAREYISTGTAYISATLSRGFDKFLEYLIDRPDELRSISSLVREDFLRGGVTCKELGGYPSFIDYVRNAEDLKKNRNKGSNKGQRSDNQMNLILNSTLSFLEWYRDYKNPNYQVPLLRSDIPDQTRRGWQNGKSTKLPVPIAVLNMCRKILTEDDYAWPRSLQSDYTIVTREDGRTERIWCPVRAIAMLMLFSLPIRSVSVRRLDSGEGDEYLFDAKSCEWLPSQLPTMEKGRSVGVVHQVIKTEHDDNTLGGFFINSNKTRHADVKLNNTRGPNKSAFSFGYIIPWNNVDLFKHITFCRDWQIRNNPIDSPRGLDSVAEHSMRVTTPVARSLPRFYFLFRDPDAVNEPVSSFKLTKMFNQVLEEAGRRLSEENNRTIDLSDHFTLHSLRVGGITAFMKSGMPLGVLTEFVAGHSTIIMNLYYQRHSAPEISDIISKAANKLEGGGLVEEDLLGRVSRIRDDTSYAPGEAFSAEGLFFQDRTALEYLRKSQKGMILVDIDGCCPVGGTMCDLGGPLDQRGEAGFNLLGMHGCATCRYHVTGEPFLAGMVIKANENIYRLRSLAKAIRELETEIAECRNSAGKRRMLQSRLDGIQLKAEQTMAEWSARVQSVLMVTSQIRSKAGSVGDRKKVTLLAKQKAVFEEGSEFRLVDFLARASDIVEADPILKDAVKLRRKVVLNKLLAKNGVKSMLLSVPDRIAQETASKLVDMMVAAIGWQGVDAAISDAKTFQELGFSITRTGEESWPKENDTDIAIMQKFLPEN